MRKSKYLMLFSLFLSALVFVPAALSADSAEMNKNKSTSWFGSDNKDEKKLPPKGANSDNRQGSQNYNDRDRGYYNDRDGGYYNDRGYYDNRGYDYQDGNGMYQRPNAPMDQQQGTCSEGGYRSY
jgi:hypothetical protein